MVRASIILLLFICSCVRPVLENENSSIKVDNALLYIKEEKYSRAIEELEYILISDPLSEHASDAQYYLSESYFYNGNYHQAIIEYEKYLSRRDLSYEFANKSQFMLCKCYYNASLEFNRDQSNTLRAIEKLQFFIEKKSMDEYIIQIEQMILELRTKLAKKDFYTAKLYIRLDELDAAVIYFNNIINDYYDTQFVNDSLINIALIYLINDITQSIRFLENHKSSFLTSNDYNETILFINNIELNKDADYYISLLK